MRRETNAVTLALFAGAIAAMYYLTRTYDLAYLAAAAVVFISAPFRARVPIQAAGLSLVILFTLTSVPTITMLLVAIATAAIFIYGGNIFGRVPWVRWEQTFGQAQGGTAYVACFAEIARASVGAVILSVVASVFSGAVPVRANGLLAFIFLISAGLLLLAIISTYIAEH